MSESNAPRNTRRRSERAEQLYNARMLPDADDSIRYEPSPAEDRAARRRQAYQQRMMEPEQPPMQPTYQRRYDETQFTPNDPINAEWDPVELSAAPVQPEWPQCEEAPVQEPFAQDAVEPLPCPPETQDSTRSSLAANLSAYYRRAANVSAQEEEDPFSAFDWTAAQPQLQEEDGSDGNPAASVNVYRMQEASWAQEERQTMLTGEDADGYQVKTEERQKPAKRRRKKRLLKRTLLVLAAVLLLAAGAVLYLSQQKPQTVQTAADSVPFATPTPQPIKGYNAAPALTVSHRTNQAIEDISGPVEMATCAVTENNVLTRSMRADGLYDYYLFASDGRLLGYFDALSANGMHPVSGGGFYVDMEPWLVDEEGHAMLPLEGLEASMGSPLTLRPPMNGWAGIRTADGESNFINREGQLISRLWFCRSFPMTGSETVAYVDTGVEDSQSRYTLYVIGGGEEGVSVKWQDGADDQQVVASALGMAYLQNGELYRLSDLLEDPAAAPLLTTPNVRFYTDCGAMVVQDPVSGKYALYVNGQQHYGFVYDSILPVESDIRWQGDILPGQAGQAMVLAVTGATYPQPLSHYFVLRQNGTEEYVALSAVSTCPVLLH